MIEVNKTGVVLEFNIEGDKEERFIAWKEIKAGVRSKIRVGVWLRGKTEVLLMPEISDDELTMIAQEADAEADEILERAKRKGYKPPAQKAAKKLKRKHKTVVG